MRDCFDWISGWKRLVGHDNENTPKSIKHDLLGSDGVMGKRLSQSDMSAIVHENVPDQAVPGYTSFMLTINLPFNIYQ